MRFLLALLGMAVVLWVPLVGVIVASCWRSDQRASRRRFGRILAFFSLWAMFNISFCAAWGAFRTLRGDQAMLTLLLMGQVVAPWLCGQIVSRAAHPALHRSP